MNPALNTVTSNDGTTIAFQRSGVGQPIVLVSPALGDHTGSEQLARFLSRNLTVVNYDRRGRGLSADTLPYAVEREVEDIDALIEASGGSAYLFGSSSGAVLALEAASQLGSRVRALLLYEPPFIVDDSRPPLPADYLDRLQDLIASNRRADAVVYFMRMAVGMPEEMLVGMQDAPMWPFLEAAAHTLPYDARIVSGMMSGNPLPAHRWDSLAASALVLDGGNSPAWIHHAAQAVAAALPRATYRTLQGLDHSAVSTAPMDIATAMYAFFLTDHMAGRSSKRNSA